MASDFKNDDLDIGLNDSSSDFFSQEEGDLFEELFAGSESMSFEDELADINIDDIDLNEVLQVSDDIEVPSFDDLSDLEGLDLVDALLSEDEEPLMSDFGIEEELASTQEHDLEKSEQEEFDQINDFADIDLMSLQIGRASCRERVWQYV